MTLPFAYFLIAALAAVNAAWFAVAMQRNRQLARVARLRDVV